MACVHVHTFIQWTPEYTYWSPSFLSSSLKNGLTALDIAESHAEEKKGYYKRRFEEVIELLNKHIEETADPPSHHEYMTVEILDMEYMYMYMYLYSLVPRLSLSRAHVIIS